MGADVADEGGGGVAQRLFGVKGGVQAGNQGAADNNAVGEFCRAVSPSRMPKPMQTGTSVSFFSVRMSAAMASACASCVPVTPRNETK